MKSDTYSYTLLSRRSLASASASSCGTRTPLLRAHLRKHPTARSMPIRTLAAAAPTSMALRLAGESGGGATGGTPSSEAGGRGGGTSGIRGGGGVERGGDGGAGGAG